MDRVQTLAQCKALISDNKKRCPKADTNCMMMVGGFEPQIAEGRLFYQVHDHGLCLYSDEARYYELFYFWDPQAPFADFRQDKTVVVGEVSRLGRRDGYIRQFDEKARAAGFRFFKKNLQIELLLQDHARQIAEGCAQSMARMEREKLRIVYCREKRQEEQVLALWYDALDETDVPLSHARFMSHPEDSVLCAVNEADQVVGAYWWGTVKRNAAEARHVVTRADYYRKGIGTALTMFCMKELLDQGFEFWRGFVATDNVKSYRMHQKIGCQASGTTITQYLL